MKKQEKKFKNKKKQLRVSLCTVCTVKHWMHKRRGESSIIRDDMPARCRGLI
jgi:hypothetical protein